VCRPFFDTTSTYFELDFADGELNDDTDNEQDPFRLRGHSKDSRPDLPQVVIGMAVTTGGLPVRLWIWPGNTTDTTVLEEVKKDLAGWQLHRTVWIADAGFASKDSHKVLTQGGSGFMVAERLRGSDADVVQARSRQGRFRQVDEHLQVKDIIVGDGPARQRSVMVRNLQAAERDAHGPGRGSRSPQPHVLDHQPFRQQSELPERRMATAHQSHRDDVRQQTEGCPSDTLVLHQRATSSRTGAQHGGRPSTVSTCKDGTSNPLLACPRVSTAMPINRRRRAGRTALAGR
jgi:hypothetical protein